MRKSIWFLFCIFTLHSSLLSFQKPILRNSDKVHLTLYQYYIIIKELLYVYCILPWWIDVSLSRNSQAECDHCFHKVASMEFYGYLMAEGDMKTIALLKQYLWNRDRTDLEHFMVYTLNKLHQQCYYCFESNHWHLAHIE